MHRRMRPCARSRFPRTAAAAGTFRVMELLIDRHDDGVVVLTLNLPERRNAMTAELTQAWGRAVPALAADRSVRCVVVTGAGTAFCSGGDLSWIETSTGLSVDDVRARMLPFYRTWLSIRDLEVP